MRLFPKIICIGTSFCMSKEILRCIFSNYVNDICKNTDHAMIIDASKYVIIFSMAIFTTYAFYTKLEQYN